MHIFIEKDKKTIEKELKNPISIHLLLKELNISNDSVILVKNKEIVLEDELISNKDTLELLSVISGG